MSQSKSKQGQAGASRRKASPLADRRIQIVLVGLALAVGIYVFQWWRSVQATAEARKQLILDTRNELIQDEPDRDRLGRFMADLKRLPDADSDSLVRALRAEIELVRERPERAYQQFRAEIDSPTATSEQHALASRILLARHEGFAGDTSVAATMLAETVRMARSAYRTSSSPRDLFRAWQAAKRLFKDALATEVGDELIAAHADSSEARLVQLSARFEPVGSARDVGNLIVDTPVPSRELRAMEALVMLGQGDVDGARKLLEKELAQAPNVWVLRFAAAIVFDAWRRSPVLDEAKSAQVLARRNKQYDWLLERAPGDYELRARWQALRAK
ncbi:MAG: hypothetical protein AB8H80_23005 [Planctomycetota bacterium]